MARKKPIAYTAKTLAWMRDRMGAEIGVVERWIGGGFIKVRSDLFGIIDLIAVPTANRNPFFEGVLGIQSTSAGCISARVKKAMEEPRLVTWMQAGGQFWVVGWKKIRYKKASFRWYPRVLKFSMTVKKGKATLTHTEHHSLPGQEAARESRKTRKG